MTPVPTRSPDWWRGTVWTTQTLIIAYLAFAAGLILQPSRFSDTPSYHNLLIFAAAQVWGCAYLLVVALFVAWRLAPHRRWLGILAHTAAVALTAWWWVAFVIRYATNSGTTIVNVVSWGVFLSLIARSAQALETHRG